MATIQKTRVLRPSTRLKTSPYKIDIKKVGVDDILEVSICKEDGTLHGQYIFNGKDLIGLDSIHFNVINGEIVWSPALPYNCKQQ